MFIFSKNYHLHEKIILLNKHDLHKSKGAQKITNLGKLPIEQKGKLPSDENKNKNHKGKLPSQKRKLPSVGNNKQA